MGAALVKRLEFTLKSRVGLGGSCLDSASADLLPAPIPPHWEGASQSGIVPEQLNQEFTSVVLRVPRNARLGDAKKAQAALRSVGFSAPSSEVWDELTLSQLRAFQSSAGLPVTGHSNIETENHLAWVPVVHGLSLLVKGDEGPAVRHLQGLLKVSVKTEYTFTPGYFDEATYGALMEFQKSYPKLQQDGVVGENTAQALELSQIQSGRAVLRSGHRGPVVARVQRVLAACGFPTGVSGIYSDATTGAVRSFQKQHGLPELGLVDQLTMEALERALGHPEDPDTRDGNGSVLEALPVAGQDFHLSRPKGEPSLIGGHEIEVFAPLGTAVVAPVSGVISNLRRRGHDGLPSVTIRRGDYYFAMRHLAAVTPTLRVGAAVRAGQRIGVLGSAQSGDRLDPHFRFAIYRGLNGQANASDSAFREFMKFLQSS